MKINNESEISMEKRIIIANLKMNLSISEIATYLKVIDEKIKTNRVIICPTSIYIPYFLKKTYKVGIQNTFFHQKGAYTGEISPYQAASMGINYTIIGHSERRIYFKENDSLINEKIIEAIKHNLGVILCIGETSEEKNMMRSNRVLKRQIINALRGVDKEKLDNIVIAYEPIWSIGTGITPTNKEIEAMTDYIKMITREYTEYEDIKVIYGGSVNIKNIKTLNEIENISGFLVGSASNNPEEFIRIVDEVFRTT